MPNEIERLTFLLNRCAIREAPREPAKLFGGSNPKTGNVAYMHAEPLRKLFPGREFPDSGLVRIDTGMGFISVVVITPLMPIHGVVFAPMSEAFKDA